MPGANNLFNQQPTPTQTVYSIYSSQPQQNPSFRFNQAQIQNPSFSFPAANQGYQTPSQATPINSFGAPSPYSYPFMGTGSNIGSSPQFHSFSANSFQPNNNPYIGNPAINIPNDYYQIPNNPYANGNPALQSIYQQVPNFYQQSQAPPSSSNFQKDPIFNLNSQQFRPFANSQFSTNGNAQFNTNGNSQFNTNGNSQFNTNGNSQFNTNGNSQFNTNGNAQGTVSVGAGSPQAQSTRFVNNQFSQSNNLVGSSQNGISGLQVLQNLMQKLSSSGMN
jgi:hypothetical protein